MTFKAWSPLRTAQEHAQATGQKTFNIAIACPRGHTGSRYSSNGNCVTCASTSRGGTKPRAETQLKLKPANNRVTQISLDEATAANVAKAKRYLREVLGQPVSASLIHKVGIGLLADYLRTSPEPSDLWRLLE